MFVAEVFDGALEQRRLTGAGRADEVESENFTAGEPGAVARGQIIVLLQHCLSELDRMAVRMVVMMVMLVMMVMRVAVSVVMGVRGMMVMGQFGLGTGAQIDHRGFGPVRAAAAFTHIVLLVH
jgi:hypothetical protein